MDVLCDVLCPYRTRVGTDFGKTTDSAPYRAGIRKRASRYRNRLFIYSNVAHKNHTNTHSCVPLSVSLSEVEQSFRELQASGEGPLSQNKA